MKLEWIMDVPLDNHIRIIMETAAAQCLHAEGITLPCGVCVRLCDDVYIASINQNTRGIPGSTDVLSFPTVDYPEGCTAGSCTDLLRQEYDDDIQACFLGDIIISVPHLYAQAAE